MKIEAHVVFHLHKQCFKALSNNEICMFTMLYDRQHNTPKTITTTPKPLDVMTPKQPEHKNPLRALFSLSCLGTVVL